MTNKDYQQAVEWLFVQAPNYQIDGQKAYKPGLDNITKLCALFGNPQEKLKTIHIGGTNGKGSTSNLLSSVLQEAGYKVGLYNSPHLIDFTERIKINGKNVSKTFVYDFITKLKNLPEDIQPSFFEYTTIMAFEYFFQEQVDYAIIEVGLGGRLDSTNIIKPIVSAITNVQLDHQNILGESLEEIANEKDGIIKKNTPIVSGEENPEIKNLFFEKAKSLGSKFVDATEFSGKLETDLKGKYQDKNIRVVQGIVEILRENDIEISDEHLKLGLLNTHKNTGFIGRWYEFASHPLTICDTAHNFAGLDVVFDQLNENPIRKHLVLGFVVDKKLDDIMKILPRNEVYYFVKPAINRGRSPYEYEDLLKENKINYKIFETVQEGYLAALQKVANDEMIFIGGSNFVVGEFLEKNLVK